MRSGSIVGFCCSLAAFTSTLCATCFFPETKPAKNESCRCEPYGPVFCPNSMWNTSAWVGIGITECGNCGGFTNCVPATITIGTSDNCIPAVDVVGIVCLPFSLPFAPSCASVCASCVGSYTVVACAPCTACLAAASPPSGIICSYCGPMKCAPSGAPIPVIRLDGWGGPAGTPCPNKGKQNAGGSPSPRLQGPMYWDGELPTDIN